MGLGHGFGGERGDDDGAVGIGEAEALAVLGFEGARERSTVGERDGQGGVGAVVFEIGGDLGGGAVGTFAQGGGRFRRQCHGALLEIARVGESALDRLFSDGAYVGEADAPCGEHAGEGVKQDRVDADGVGDGAGVLAAGAAEGDEHVFGRVVAALDRDLLDRLGHVLVGDAQEAFGGGFSGDGLAGFGFDLGAEVFEPGDDDVAIERLIGVGAEDGGEEFGTHAAEQDVAVGDRERAAAAIGGGAGVGAGAHRPHAQAHAVEEADGAATGGHGVDLQHGSGEAHAGDDGFVGAFELAGIVRDVGGSAAHVEAEGVGEAGAARGGGHADDAAGGAGEHRVAAAEGVGVREAAIGLHEEEV